MSARTRKACMNCGRKKVRCPNEGDHRPCTRCVQSGLDCVWPPPRVQATGGSQNKTACDACRKDRVRCSPVEDQDGDRRCTYCREKGVECSYIDSEQAHDDPAEPVAGPSNYPGALAIDRPALTVDPTAGVEGPGPSSTSVSPIARTNSDGPPSTSVSPITRTNSPSRGNWMEVCLAPSPEAETYEETLYEAYAAQ